jgi:hypothetical protein
LESHELDASRNPIKDALHGTDTNWKHRPFSFYTGIRTDVELVSAQAHFGFVVDRVLSDRADPERGTRGGGDGGDFGRAAEVGGSEDEA